MCRGYPFEPINKIEIVYVHSCKYHKEKKYDYSGLFENCWYFKVFKF